MFWLQNNIQGYFHNCWLWKMVKCPKQEFLQLNYIYFNKFVHIYFERFVHNKENKRLYCSMQ